MNPKNAPKAYRFGAAVFLIILAIVRATFHSKLEGVMDSVFFSLIGAGLALALLPIERLTSVKAAGFEFSLGQPQVAAAIDALGPDRLKSDELRIKLSRVQHLLPIIRGSRVLWIDDHPHKVLGARRVLRALDVEVISAISSSNAEEILTADNDFDLLITDIQREGDTYKETGGEPIHEGVNLIVKIRKQHNDPVIKALPVIFYAAYDRERLIRFTREVRALQPEAEVANSFLELLPKVVSTLADSRSQPLVAPSEKEATPLKSQAGRPIG